MCRTKLSQADEERDRFKHEVEILEEQKVYHRYALLV